jgi:transcriptional regulator with XRE-family HTH domain
VNTFLRDRRRQQALSAEALARRLDVHPMSVLRWERRERLPGPGHVRALASALELERAAVTGFFDEARTPAIPPAGFRGHGLRGLREGAGVPVRHLARRLDVLPATV